MQAVVSKSARAAVLAGSSRAPCAPRLPSRAVVRAQKQEDDSKEASSLKLYSVAPRKSRGCKLPEPTPSLLPVIAAQRRCAIVATGHRGGSVCGS